MCYSPGTVAVDCQRKQRDEFNRLPVSAAWTGLGLVPDVLRVLPAILREYSLQCVWVLCRYIMACSKIIVVYSELFKVSSCEYIIKNILDSLNKNYVSSKYYLSFATNTFMYVSGYFIFWDSHKFRIFQISSLFYKWINYKCFAAKSDVSCLWSIMMSCKANNLKTCI